MKKEPKTNEKFIVNSFRSDMYTYHSGKPKPPEKNFVISRDLNGETVNVYGDYLYDLSLYSRREKSNKINFNLIPSIIRDEAKWLWFLVYFHGKGRNKNSLSVSTLLRVFDSFIRPLSSHAIANELTLTEILSNEKNLTIYIHNHQKEHYQKGAQTFLSLYLRLGKGITGFNVAYTNTLSNFVSKSVSALRYQRKQVAVIPPRIYKIKHQQLWQIVEDVEPHLVGLEKLICKLIDETTIRVFKKENAGRSTTSLQAREVDLKVWISEFNLENYAEKQQWGNCRRTIPSRLTDIQRACKELIHFYTGMRSNEVLQLNYHCLNLDKSQNRPRARIIGNTSKYTGSNKHVKWVTSSEIERVIKILQAISRPIGKKLGLSFKHDATYPCPLFLSPIYLTRFKATTKNHPRGKRPDIFNLNIQNNPCYNRDIFIITEEDLTFLERIDPERNWRDINDNFCVSQEWHFTSHQYRRSLAVYAAQSGLVSMGSLQQQLKHLLKEVTFYYANGAENSSGLFSLGDKHIAKVYALNKPLADFTAQAINILFDKEPLLGPLGLSLDKKGEKGHTKEEQNSILLENRAQTMKKFKTGQLAYKETALGGCASTHPCDSFLTRSFISCLTCEQAAIKPSKLKEGISILQREAAELNPNSIEYYSEKADLDALLKFAQKNNVRLTK